MVQGHGKRRATCRCAQNTELFTVDIKDFKRILSPLQQDSLQAKMAFLKQVLLSKPRTGLYCSSCRTNPWMRQCLSCETPFLQGVAIARRSKVGTSAILCCLLVLCPGMACFAMPMLYSRQSVIRVWCCWSGSLASVRLCRQEGFAGMSSEVKMLKMSL